jgi:hypothetical protein
MALPSRATRFCPSGFGSPVPKPRGPPQSFARNLSACYPGGVMLPLVTQADGRTGGDVSTPCQLRPVSGARVASQQSLILRDG